MNGVDTATAPAPARGGLRALLNPGWISVILLAIVFAGLSWTVLAPWQFDRHAERTERNNLINAAIASAPVPVTDVLSTTGQPEEHLSWLPVTATGTFVGSEQTYVGLRQLNGKPAFEIVLPFRLSTGELLMVDRGYLAGADYAAGYRPDPTPAGVVTITGRVQAEQPDPSGRQATVIGDRTEVRGISAQSLLDGTAPVLRGFIQLIDQSPGVLTPIGVPQTESGPYLSYAYQWITFGAVAVLAIGFFAYREVTDPPERLSYPATPAGSGPIPPSPGEPLGDDARPEPSMAGPDERHRPRRSRGFDKSDLYD